MKRKFKLLQYRPEVIDACPRLMRTGGMVGDREAAALGSPAARTTPAVEAVTWSITSVSDPAETMGGRRHQVGGAL